MTKPSQLAPTTGCPASALWSAMPSSACRTPLSRTYTLGDFTSRLPMFAWKGGNRRTSSRSARRST